jgi:hypothetical protein
MKHATQKNRPFEDPWKGEIVYLFLFSFIIK